MNRLTHFANKRVTKRMRFLRAGHDRGMIGPRLALGGVVCWGVCPMGRGGSIAGRGGVVIGLRHHAAPIAGGIVNRPPVGVMTKHPPVFQSCFG
jgi:hypothetical protein